MKLTVNGVEHELEVSPDAKLADVLRHHLGLTGTKIGCGDGQCGSCTVLLDGRPVRSCIYPAKRAVGKQILTIEGLAASWGDTEGLHPLQRAFIDHGTVQCGFCTPGLLMSAAALWNKLVAATPFTPPTEADIKRALSRNACRCTGYASVLRAFKSAIHEHQTGEPLPPIEIETLTPLQRDRPFPSPAGRRRQSHGHGQVHGRLHLPRYALRSHAARRIPARPDSRHRYQQSRRATRRPRRPDPQRRTRRQSSRPRLHRLARPLRRQSALYGRRRRHRGRRFAGNRQSRTRTDQSRLRAAARGGQRGASPPARRTARPRRK